ncbi:MAG: heme NO-binding domain-containing protein [Pseudomonadota bacterium]
MRFAFGGAYTSVGTYDHTEMLDMLTFLHTATGQEVSDMVIAFGKHLFGQLADSHKAIFADQNRVLDFLEGIERHIHAEVRKLYPDAELPKFDTERVSDGHLVMIYESARPFADLAYGMIEGASAHFDTGLQITRKDEVSATGKSTRFDVVLL